MEIRTIGIIGCGRFGSLLHNILKNDFELFVYDKHIDANHTRGIEVQQNLSSIRCCNAVFFCVPILQFEASIKEVRPFINDNAAILDVCSVKLYPAKIMHRYFSTARTLPTHPMFGPAAAAEGISGLPFVLCPDGTQEEYVSYWRGYLRQKGFKVVEISCDEHDRVTAYSLCITQLLGRVLGRLDLTSSEIDTKSFRKLLEIRDISCGNSFELFKGIINYNPYANEMIQKLKKSLNDLENNLKE